MEKLGIILLVGVFCLIGIWQFSKARSVQIFGDLVSRVETSLPLVGLTFDDGPSKKFTSDVLQILAQNDVTATFFVTGKEADENPNQMRALVTAGHELGNHSYSHRRMVLISPNQVRSELENTDAAIRAAGFKGTIHFRPPYGSRLLVLPWILRAQDRLTVMWDVAPDADYELPAEIIARNALEKARVGSIILLHPMYSSRENTRKALGELIVGLREKGLEPVPISRLLAAQEEP